MVVPVRASFLLLLLVVVVVVVARGVE